MNPALEHAPNISRRGAKIFGQSEVHRVNNPMLPLVTRCYCWPPESPSSSVCISSASLSDKSYMYDNACNRTYRSLIIRVNHLRLTLQHQILELIQVYLRNIGHFDICLYLLKIPPYLAIHA